MNIRLFAHLIFSSNNGKITSFEIAQYLPWEFLYIELLKM